MQNNFGISPLLTLDVSNRWRFPLVTLWWNVEWLLTRSFIWCFVIDSSWEGWRKSCSTECQQQQQQL
jgi:hypothetical protein